MILALTSSAGSKMLVGVVPGGSGVKEMLYRWYGRSGDIDADTKLAENDLCTPERKAFTTLGQTVETGARIEHTLEHGSPQRN